MGKKLTPPEIGQHVIDNPSTGFDQCCKCQGVETQGTMKSLDEDALSFDLICDECYEEITFKENFTQFISKQVEDAVELMFANAHGMAMTTSGDITPEQNEQLEEIKENLKQLIAAQTLQNLTDDQKKKLGINVCSNCNFDMGEGYVNCGAAGDGICPECGQDDAAPEAGPQKVQVQSYFYEGDEEKGDAAKWWKLMFGDELVELGFASPEKAAEWAREQGYIPMSQEPEAYEVSVCRTGFGFHKISVQARSQEEAEELALDEAGDHLYSEKSSEYTLDGTTKL